MKKKTAFMLFWLFCGIHSAFAVEHMLPYPGGETWRCSQGNHNDTDHNYIGWFKWVGTSFVSCTEGTSNCIEQWSNPTHRADNNMAFAWDCEKPDEHSQGSHQIFGMSVTELSGSFKNEFTQFCGVQIFKLTMHYVKQAHNGWTMQIQR